MPSKLRLRGHLLAMIDCLLESWEIDPPNERKIQQGVQLVEVDDRQDELVRDQGGGDLANLCLEFVQTVGGKLIEPDLDFERAPRRAGRLLQQLLNGRSELDLAKELL